MRTNLCTHGCKRIEFVDNGLYQELLLRGIRLDSGDILFDFLDFCLTGREHAFKKIGSVDQTIKRSR